MTTRFIKAVTLIALAVFSTQALADPPARVGRVSLAQGQVSISSEVGDEASAALVNWPVTSHNQVTTGRGARTEIRIGSTSLRLDADSSMEVSELDDDSLRLHLNYGSVSVRILSADVLPGFELSTPNGRVRLQEPGRLRVDAERERGTTRGERVRRRGGGRRPWLAADRPRRQARRDPRRRRAHRFRRARRLRRLGPGARPARRQLDLRPLRHHRNDRLRRPRPERQPGATTPNTARCGSRARLRRTGRLPRRQLDLGVAMGLDLGRQCAVGLRAVPLRALGVCRTSAGAGRRAAMSAVRCGRRRWSAGSAAAAGASASARAAATARPAQGWYPLSPRDSFVPGYRLSHDHLQRINRDARAGWAPRRRPRRRASTIAMA